MNVEIRNVSRVAKRTAMMVTMAFVLLWLPGGAGRWQVLAAPPAQTEIDVVQVVDVINRWHLSAFRSYKFNGWISWDAIATTHHNLNISLLTSYLSGTPYEATQTINTIPYVADPSDLGYIGSSLGAQTYYFSERGALRTDTVTRTDIAVNYSFFLNIGGGQLEVFLQPEVINLFNESAVVVPNTTVLGPRQGMEAFNPFDEMPVQGVNWDFGPNFSEAQAWTDFQQPRTFRFSVGVRF